MIPRLLAERGCPFAHRVHALLVHVGAAYEIVESAIGQHPAELASHSPSGRVPFLVHGELAIGESRVMLEYLAEVYAFAEAYPSNAAARALHREAMAVVDAHFATALFVDTRLTEARLGEVVDRLAAVAAFTPASSPSLLAFHVAPVWQRLRWWKPECRVTRALGERPLLVEWLDATTRLPAIAKTSPTRAENVRDFHDAMCAVAQSSAPSP